MGLEGVALVGAWIGGLLGAVVLVAGLLMLLRWFMQVTSPSFGFNFSCLMNLLAQKFRRDFTVLQAVPSGAVTEHAARALHYLGCTSLFSAPNLQSTVTHRHLT